MMSKIGFVAGLVATALATGACAPRPAEFALPEGDVANGQALFVSMSCTSCHSVRNLDLPAPDEEGPVTVALGGRVSEVKTYAELVTAVINPSHELIKRHDPDDVSVDGQSLMRVYNDTMTVSEMIDIVAFLDSRYEEFERPDVNYRTR